MMSENQPPIPSPMQSLLSSPKSIHFIGIGGIGMSGIAEVLHHYGHKISGSDQKENANTNRLKKLGLTIFTPQKRENLAACDIVVFSSAIKEDNPEKVAAKELGIAMLHRSEMLSHILCLKKSICVSGTHGKTTTTSLIANVLDEGNLDPTIINGGIINRYNNNIKMGNSTWAVAEADESDSSMIRMNTTFAVVTNIDPEHLDHYQTFEKLKQAFVTFMNSVPEDGCTIMCNDHPVIQELAGDITHDRTITYGFSETSEIKADNLKFFSDACTFDIHICPALLSKYNACLPQKLEGVRLSTVGKHNVQNALSAVAIAIVLGLSEQQLRNGLNTFAGVQRRFTQTGITPSGARVIDDYAHHPVEIAALIETARHTCPTSKIYALMQPHKYSRLRDLFEDFSHAFKGVDEVLLAPVYSAGEQPIEGINTLTLAKKVIENGIANTRTVASVEEAARYLEQRVGHGDIILCIGAGDITQWAYQLPDLIGKNKVSASG